jgi:hypothetical protein
MLWGPLGHEKSVSSNFDRTYRIAPLNCPRSKQVFCLGAVTPFFLVSCPKMTEAIADIHLLH